jgi:hypothetical protein
MQATPFQTFRELENSFFLTDGALASEGRKEGFAQKDAKITLELELDCQSDGSRR